MSDRRRAAPIPSDDRDAARLFALAVQAAADREQRIDGPPLPPRVEPTDDELAEIWARAGSRARAAWRGFALGWRADRA